MKSFHFGIVLSTPRMLIYLRFHFLANVQRLMLTKLNAMDSIVLSTCNACCTILFLCKMVSPPDSPLQPLAYEPSSLFDQAYMSDQVSGGLFLICREYCQVVVHQVNCLWVDN